MSSIRSFLRSAPMRAGLLLACVALLAACGERAQDSAARPAAPASAQPQPPIAPPPLKDVLETTATHVVGITFPPALSKYPGLALEAQRYAEQARRHVVDAARQRADDPAAGPYELSLEFELRHESPDIVVLAVDGSSYTGGAHGSPMIRRWVWLPPENRVLTAAQLFPREGSWHSISTTVRAQLRSAVAQRMDADRVPPAERAALARDAAVMIDGGTEARAEDFAVFEPVMTANGKITALRFVFPPYQVGPYADGMHTVELPAAQLMGMVDPRYRPLFEAA